MKDSLRYSLVFSAGWAVFLLLSKVALSAGAGALAFSIQITFLSAAFLLAYGLASKRLAMPDQRTAGTIFVIAVLSDLATVTGFYGLERSSLINYGFLINTVVVFTILLSALFLKDRLSWKKAILAAAILAGAYFISTEGSAIVPVSGDIIIVFSAFLFSVTDVMAKPVLSKMDAYNFTLLLVLLGSAAFIPVPLLASQDIPGIASLPVTLAAGLFSAISLPLFYNTMRLTTASYTSMFSTLAPVLVLALGFFVLNETLNIYQLAGGALILAAIVMLARE